VLPVLARHLGIDAVLVAIPSASGLEMTQILQRCNESGVECKTVPNLAQMITTRDLAAQIREVAVEDLLGRPPVAISSDQIGILLEGQSVLVTGAGGSRLGLNCVTR
jgi:FlaA1/EpsC-like NDP-sugar epimerase